MDHGPTRAERLPELYRAILDAVGDLERRGARHDAARVRQAAVRAYRVWDERAEQRLTRILAEVAPEQAGSDRRPRRYWSLRVWLVRPSRAPSSSPPPAPSRAPSSPTAPTA